MSDGDRRIGLLFAGAPSVPKMVDLAIRAEQAGYESVWVAETRMTRDGFTPLAAIGMATERIKLATGIVNVYTRGAVVLAISFATLAEIAPGRTIVGLGPGSPLVLRPQGVEWDRPLRRLREYSETMRPLLRGEPVTYEGDTMRLENAQIEDVLQHEGDAIGHGQDLPQYFGVTGMTAVALAGELADGVIYNSCLGVEYVGRAAEAIEEGAARVGRNAADVDVAMAILSSPDRDSATGKRRAHEFCSLYLSLFPNIARESGVDPELVAATREAFTSGGVEAAQQVLPLEVVNQLCAAGTPEECQDRIDEYREAGVAMPVLIALDGTIDLAVETLR